MQAKHLSDGAGISLVQHYLLSDAVDRFVEEVGQNPLFRLNKKQKIYLKTGYRLPQDDRPAMQRLVYLDFFPTLGQMAANEKTLSYLLWHMTKIPLSEGSFGRMTLYATLVDSEPVLAIDDIQPSRGFRQLLQTQPQSYRHYPWVHYGLAFLNNYFLKHPELIKNIVAPTRSAVRKAGQISDHRRTISQGDRKRYYQRPFRDLGWRRFYCPRLFWLNDKKSSDYELWSAPENLPKRLSKLFLNFGL
jgi:hypothetical protein